MFGSDPFGGLTDRGQIFTLPPEIVHREAQAVADDDYPTFGFDLTSNI